ncbi:MAG: sensor histidine kinase [Acidobacteria bacterium]|nr:sensor histidine kinase [Acidobacteriota bacterium]
MLLAPDSRPRPEVRLTRFRKATRVALICGFGAMLSLLIFASVHLIRGLNHLQVATIESDRQFLENDRLLDRLRLTFFSMGTNLRDYLLDPNPTTAEQSLATLLRQSAEMKTTIRDYRAVMPREDRPALLQFEETHEKYWKVVMPVLEWDHVRRKRDGFTYLQQYVFPARLQLLEVADELGRLNEMRLRASDVQFADIAREVRQRMVVNTVIAVALGGILCLLTSIYILRLERDLAVRYLEISQARAELETLSAGIVAAQEEERRGISRELHDEVGQSLSALLVDVGNATAAAGKDNPRLLDNLRSIRRLAEGSLQVVRNMSLLLRPSMLDDFGLVPALRWQAREFLRRHAVEVEVKASEIADSLPDPVNTCIYRVVQEALNNVARHADATHVSVFVRNESGRVLVAIQDNGKGFNPTSEKGLGLLGIEERARHFGGRARVESAPGKGTLVQVELPLPEPLVEGVPA